LLPASKKDRKRKGRFEGEIFLNLNRGEQCQENRGGRDFEKGRKQTKEREGIELR
jgi:hypothetical protein